MNNKAWYGIGAVAVVLIVIIILASSGRQRPSSPDGSSSDQAAPVETARVAKLTLRSFIVSGATKTCTFSIPGSATSSSMTGTIYMSSQNMRGDFVTTDVAGKATSAHMVIANGIDYLWNDTQPRGIKLPWSLAASSTSSLASRAGVDIDQPAAYSCADWTADQSKFALPAAR